MSTGRRKPQDRSKDIRLDVTTNLAWGVVLSFGAAWACALWAPTGGLERNRPADVERLQSDYPGRLRQGVFTKRVSGLGLRVISAAAVDDDSGEAFPTLSLAGLPWACLEGTPRAAGGRHRAALAAPAWLQPPWPPRGEAPRRILPLQPLPLGLLVDTLFWAAMAWALGRLRRSNTDPWDPVISP